MVADLISTPSPQTRTRRDLASFSPSSSADPNERFDSAAADCGLAAAATWSTAMARGFDPNAVACDFDHLIFWLVLIDPTFTCDARTIERCRAEKTTWQFLVETPPTESHLPRRCWSRQACRGRDSLTAKRAGLRPADLRPKRKLFDVGIPFQRCAVGTQSTSLPVIMKQMLEPVPPGAGKDLNPQACSRRCQCLHLRLLTGRLRDNGNTSLPLPLHDEKGGGLTL